MMEGDLSSRKSKARDMDLAEEKRSESIVVIL